MWQCWQQEPEARPTFLEIGKTLHRLMTAERVSSKERLQLYKLDDRESWWGKFHSMVFWSKDALKSFKIVRQQTRISNPSEDSNLRYTKLRFGGWFLIGNSEFFFYDKTRKHRSLWEIIFQCCCCWLFCDHLFGSKALHILAYYCFYLN